MESYSPGLRRRLADRLVSRLFVCVGVPENHVVKRTIRLAWVEAARDVLKEAHRVANGIGKGEFTTDFQEFAHGLRFELDKEADRALDERPERNLGTSPIDAYLEPFVSVLGAHLATGLSDPERAALSQAFPKVVAKLTGWEQARIPLIVQTLARDGYRVGEGAPRDFTERVLDMLASFLQNPDKYPKSGPALHAALMEFQSRELKQLLATQSEALAGLTGSPQLANTLQIDLEEMEKRLGGQIAQVGAGVGEANSKLDRIERFVRGAFGENADPFSPGAFALGSENAVIFAWYQGGDDWWDKCANHLRSALDRLGPDYVLVPQAWDFNRFDLQTPQGRSHALRGMWAGFDGSKGNNHAASLVLLGCALSDPIPCGGRFEDRLEENGLLAGKDTDGGFFVADGMAREDRRGQIRAGRIPITLETRLILETRLSGRPLVVVDGTGGDPCETEVGSLLAWLRDADIPVCRLEHMLSDDGWALPLVRDIFGIAVSATPNPYRRLDHYLPENAGQFFGRDKQSDEARRWLETRRGVLSITGPSGVGKSSFLHARVAWLLAEAGYEHLIFRPTDLRLDHGRHTPVLAFCRMLADRLGLEQVDPLVVLPDPEKAKTAALVWIERTIPQDRQLFLAIDQFEEIVDAIANGLAEEGWRAVLELVAELARRRGYPLAITLEDSRREIYDRCMKGTPYHDAEEIVLSDKDADFARAIIAAPFADAGFTLGEDVVARLVAEFGEHSAADDDGSGASALPLLALKLYSLFDHVTRSPVLAAKSPKRVFGEGGAVITLDELGSFPLSITEEIKNLADQAWTETDGGTEADLGSFLRPFVSVVPGEDGSEGSAGRLVLNSVPARPFYSAAARQAAFLQRRLIVPTPRGYRLTHQAVIRRWPFAAAWFKKEAQNILQQGLFLQRAAEWDEAGRSAIENASPEEVALAASLLMLRAIDWAVEDSDSLSAEDRRDRDFARAVFATTDDAKTPVVNSETGNRYVHVAAAHSMTDTLRRMLDKTPDAIDLRRDDMRAPLANAAWSSAETVAFLLERGADPHLPEKDGFRPIDSAIWAGHDAVFDLLLARMDPGRSGEDWIDPLYSAARRGRMDYMVKLEKHGFRHDSVALHSLNSLMGAAMNGDPALFEYCLAHCDVTRRSDHGLSAFDFLAQNGQTELMLVFLQHPDGAACLDAGPDGTSPLMQAAAALQPESVAFLLKAGVDPNALSQGDGSKGRVALHYALDWLARHNGPAPRFVADQTRDTLRALLESEAIDVSIADAEGKTAYEMVAHHPRLRSMLVAHPSFAPSAIPTGTDTPLHSAIKALGTEQARNDGSNTAKQEEAIREFLADPRYIDILFQPGAEQHIPVEGLIKFGLGDDVLALVEAGKISPWPDAPKVVILPAAWQAGHTGLIAAATKALPEAVALEQAIRLANVLSDFQAPAMLNTYDPEFAVLTDSIARCPIPQEARDSVLLVAARLGNLALFDRMLTDGANPGATDSWGRDVMARASDFIRINRGGAVPAGGRSLLPLPASLRRSTGRNWPKVIWPRSANS